MKRRGQPSRQWPTVWQQQLRMTNIKTETPKTSKAARKTTKAWPPPMTCLLCRCLVPLCSPTQPAALVRHMEEEHRVYFQAPLLLKLHLLSEEQREVVADLALPCEPRVLERLLEEEQGEAWVALEEGEEHLAPPFTLYDEVEGSERFYKEREVGGLYTNLTNPQNNNLQEFINSLPTNLTYHSTFATKPEAMEESSETAEGAEGDPSKRKNKLQKTECKICKKMLAKGSLKKHMEVLHAGVKLDCDKCSEDFDTRKELWIHKQKVHQAMKKGRVEKVKSVNDNSKDSENSMDSNSTLVIDENPLDSSLGFGDNTLDSSLGLDDNTMDSSMFESTLNETLNSLEENV